VRRGSWETKENATQSGNARGPSESSATPIAQRRHRLRSALSGFATRSEFGPDAVSPVLVLRSHYAVGRFLGYVVFRTVGPRRSQLSERCNLSSSFALLSESGRRYLAGRPKPAGSSRGLSIPTAHSRPGGPLYAGLPYPATVRLQGLATLVTAYALQARAGFVSHRQRSWDSPFGAFPSRRGTDRLSPADEPTCRFSRRYSRRVGGGPAQRAAASGLLPSRESLAPNRAINAANAGCSLGVLPS